jgi:hypothetical protein
MLNPFCIMPAGIFTNYYVQYHYYSFSKIIPFYFIIKYKDKGPSVLYI